MLGIYSYDEFTEQYTEHSTDGSFSNPITNLHDPMETSVVIKKLFLRNNDSSYYYTDVSLQWLPATETVNNPTGWSYKVLVQDAQPTAAQWAAVTSGNTEEVGTVGSATDPDLSFLTVWTRVEVPRATSSGVYDSVYLSIQYDSEVPIV